VRQLVHLAAAQRDIVEILDFITRQSGSLAVATGFTDPLRAQRRRLAALPGTLGRPRPELRTDIRSFPFKGYVIFFRCDDDTVEIVNILQGHRDIVGYFDDRSSVAN